MMDRETLPKTEWYLRAVGWTIRELFSIVWDTLSTSTVSEYMLLAVFVVSTGVVLYILFNFFKFLIRFAWVLILIAGYEMVKAYVLRGG